MWAPVILSLVCTAGAAHVLHEARAAREFSAWSPRERVQPDAIVPVRIGLKQNNLDVGPDRLLALSHPGSKDYGKYLSAEEVHELFAPSQPAVDAVRKWLIEAGIDEAVIMHSDNKGWLALNIPARYAEDLFQAELFEYEHTSSGDLRIGCEQYHLPAHLTEHVDYVTPGVKLSARLRKRYVKSNGQLQPRGRRHGGATSRPIGLEQDSTDNGSEVAPTAYGLPKDLQNCAKNMTPPCWRALYGLPLNHIKDDVNDAAVFEQGDYFAQSDISKYFKTFAPNVPPNTSPIVQGIDGGMAPVPADNLKLNGGESDLDVVIITSLIYPQPMVVYQVDDQHYALQEVALDNTFNTFLDALDGSYCNYTAYGITGDSPGIDPTYPDPAKKGYKGKLQCGVYKPKRVISISYGEAERDLPKKYIQRQCNEWMKLGLQGHTILIASGDFGVGQPPGDSTKSGCLSEHGQNQTIYNPDYPDDCPWTTSVGATRLYPNQTIQDRESVMQVNLYSKGESEALKYFASTGGFSNYFRRPSYQKKAVMSYLQHHDPGHKYYIANKNASNIGENGGIYNRLGRGMPDVSANGAYMPLYTNGTLFHEFGTSLASPIWAAVVTLLNQRRTKAGKGPIGFINPALYENPSMLNDVVNGSNPNCGSSGFPAAPGWDPSSGLGTPNFPKMLKYFMELP